MKFNCFCNLISIYYDLKEREREREREREMLVDGRIGQQLFPPSQFTR